MSDSPTLDKYLSGRDAPGASSTDPEPVPEDVGTFGWLRGIRDRAIMLELRKKDGSVRAVGYAWLEQVEIDPSGIITLTVADQKIRLKGRNLNAEIRPGVRLFEGLVRHRVPWVREADHGEVLGAAERTTLVERISWSGDTAPPSP